MPVAVKLSMTPQSLEVIRKHADRPRKVVTELRRALGQGLEETAAYVQVTYLSDTYSAGRIGARGSVAARSGALRRAVRSAVDPAGAGAGLVSGWVGTAQGPASAYARVQLGDGSTTIRPRKANHLWVPIADNLNASGLPRYSPRELMGMRDEKGGRVLRIFTSKAGNLVAVLPETREASTITDLDRYGQLVYVRTRRRFKRGPRKGQSRGRLMFVLKDEVTVEGTDALAKGLSERLPRISQLLQQGLGKGLATDERG